MVADLLKEPVTAESAVRIALLNNPGMQGSLATLGVSDALRVQAGRLPNPHFSIGRFRMGDEVEIERLLSFNLIGLLTLPWKAQWQNQQHELAKLQAAQDVIRLAADTRKAWIMAVAAAAERELHARRQGSCRGRRRTGAAHGAGRQLEQIAPGARTGDAQ